ARGGDPGAAAGLARAVLAVSIAAMWAVFAVSPAVSIEARHVMSAGFCVLPLALVEGRNWWRQAAGTVTRFALAAAVLAYVVAPSAYGMASVAAKVWRFPADYAPASSGIYNHLLANSSAA